MVDKETQERWDRTDRLYDWEREMDFLPETWMEAEAGSEEYSFVNAKMNPDGSMSKADPEQEYPKAECSE